MSNHSSRGRPQAEKNIFPKVPDCERVRLSFKIAVIMSFKIQGSDEFRYLNEDEFRDSSDDNFRDETTM